MLFYPTLFDTLLLCNFYCIATYGTELYYLNAVLDNEIVLYDVLCYVSSLLLEACLLRVSCGFFTNFHSFSL